MRAAVFVLQMSSDCQMKKLEEQLSESNRRGDDLQRALTELSVAKNRLSGTMMLDSLNSILALTLTQSLPKSFKPITVWCIISSRIE